MSVKRKNNSIWSISEHTVFGIEKSCSPYYDDILFLYLSCVPRTSKIHSSELQSEIDVIRSRWLSEVWNASETKHESSTLAAHFFSLCHMTTMTLLCSRNCQLQCPSTQSIHFSDIITQHSRCTWSWILNSLARDIPITDQSSMSWCAGQKVGRASISPMPWCWWLPCEIRTTWKQNTGLPSLSPVLKKRFVDLQSLILKIFAAGLKRLL